MKKLGKDINPFNKMQWNWKARAFRLFVAMLLMAVLGLIVLWLHIINELWSKTF